MRRKPGTLLPIEVSILDVGISLAQRGSPRFHGFLVAKELEDAEGARRLVGYGTLYKALDRLERAGLLQSFWEDPQVAAAEHRIRRRFYEVTALGVRALEEAERQQAAPAPSCLLGRPAPA